MYFLWLTISTWDNFSSSFYTLSNLRRKNEQKNHSRSRNQQNVLFRGIEFIQIVKLLCCSSNYWEWIIVTGGPTHVPVFLIIWHWLSNFSQLVKRCTFFHVSRLATQLLNMKDDCVICKPKMKKESKLGPRGVKPPRGLIYKGLPMFIGHEAKHWTLFVVGPTFLEIGV